MNKPSNILPDVSVEPLEAVAHAILAGDFSSLPEGDYNRYSNEEWASEAQSAIECEDYSELTRMIAEGVAQLAYDDAAYRHDLAQRNKPFLNYRDFDDFSEWFERDESYWLAKAAESYAPPVPAGRV